MPLLYIFFGIIILLCFTIILFPADYFENYYLVKSMNDNVTVDVASFCNYKQTDMERIYCVNEFVADNFNYSRKGLVYGSELIDSGGDCKSWTNFYNSVLFLMNISTQVIYLDNHTYVVAYSNDYYCNLDQQNIDCVIFNTEVKQE